MELTPCLVQIDDHQRIDICCYWEKGHIQKVFLLWQSLILKKWANLMCGLLCELHYWHAGSISENPIYCKTYELQPETCYPHGNLNVGPQITTTVFESHVGISEGCFICTKVAIKQQSLLPLYNSPVIIVSTSRAPNCQCDLSKSHINIIS